MRGSSHALRGCSHALRGCPHALRGCPHALRGNLQRLRYEPEYPLKVSFCGEETFRRICRSRTVITSGIRCMK